MLTSVDQVLLMPGMSGCSIPSNWLSSIVQAADAAVKKYCKRDLELRSYEQYYDGNAARDIILKQFPVWMGNSTLDASMDGLTLPQATITLASTSGFAPGPPSGNNFLTARKASIQVGVSTWTTISYTGISGSSLTGCSGGTGTLSTGNRVTQPIVYFQPGAYAGQAPDSFGDNTIIVLGNQVMVKVDNAEGNQSERGTLRRIGGSGAAFVGFFPENFYSGKLAAYRQPFWQRGDLNIKVCYTAGYDSIPYDLQHATNMLVALMARITPAGANLSSQNLGGYAYSVLMNPENPDSGDIRRLLAPYREISW